VGLLAEEYDPVAGHQLGNFPQAFSHIGLVGTALALFGGEEGRTRRGQDRAMDLGLKDRVYVVTGATRGLGHASARELVGDGAKVIITGRDEKTVAEAATELGPNAHGVAVDNSDPEAPQSLIAAARERFGGFDGILISVGGPPPGFVADNTDEQWQSAFESVFLGAVRLARAAAAELGEGGVIGFVLSGSVHEPIPGLTISNGCVPVSRVSPSRSPTSWGRAASVWWGAAGPDRHGSRARAGRVTRRTRRRRGRPTRRGFRCGGTGRRRSSAGRPRSCCLRPPPI
jgi:NAD(P)-dependent dehydrogenase (short-subunit alcohol dehydrogenase family)